MNTSNCFCLEHLSSISAFMDRVNSVAVVVRLRRMKAVLQQLASSVSDVAAAAAVVVVEVVSAADEDCAEDADENDDDEAPAEHQECQVGFGDKSGHGTVNSGIQMNKRDIILGMF